MLCEASYKKHTGMLSIQEAADPPVLTWRAIEEDAPIASVELPLKQLLKLQATPATSAKILLKVMMVQGATPVADHVFLFTNRSTMNNIKEQLFQIISRQALVMPGGVLALRPPLAAPTSATTTLPLPFDAAELDDGRLQKNRDLQQAMLRKNPELFKAFQEAVMKDGLSPREFWSTRTHLLRTFALEQAQKRGPYNVLLTIRTVATLENQVNVLISIDKIHAIFEQYPIVQMAYDEQVPRMSEGEFWKRFFTSKLFRKLRGEKLTDLDRGDLVLDKYCNVDPDAVNASEPRATAVSTFINVAANELDTSEKLGNGPDITMKGDTDAGLLLVIRNINRLSSKIVQVSQAQQHEQENELEYRDLEQVAPPSYVELKVKNYNWGKQGASENSNTAVPADPLPPVWDLTTLWTAPEHAAAAHAALQDIQHHIRANVKQLKQTWNVQGLGTDANTVLADADPHLPDADLELLRLTHLTTQEFMKHYWAHLTRLPSAPPIQGGLAKLHQSLLKCQERIALAEAEVALHGQDTDGKNMFKVYAEAYMASTKRALAAALSAYVPR